MVGCRGSRPAQVVGFEVTLDPEGRTPLAAEARLESSLPCRVLSLAIDGVETGLEFPEFQAVQTVRILGLKADADQRVQLQLLDEAGHKVWTPEVSVKTAPLPNDFPTLKVVTQQSDRDSRFLMFFVAQRTTGAKVPKLGYLMILDSHANVVWYQKFDSLLNEVRLDPKGHLVIMDLWNLQIIEQDLLGRELRVFQADLLKTENEGGIRVRTDTFHHDFQKDPSTGLLWTLGTRVRGDALDDLILSIDSQGQIQRSLSLMEILDPERRIYRSKMSLWDNLYREHYYDWGHANSLVLDESRKSALVSLRHQDAIVEVGLEQGDLKWILAPPEGWSEPFQKYLLRPLGEFQWPRRQHAAQWTSKGTLLLYDNGLKESRAVEFEIDPKARTCRQIWEFRDEQPFRSRFLCDVDEVPGSDNVIVTDGGRQTKEGQYWARILEVTRSTPSEKVFEIQIHFPQGEGCTIYRSDQFSSLYGEDKTD